MVDVVATPVRAGTSYVEWGAVFAGALTASALSFILLTAGGAIGLSLISPYSHESYTKTAASIAVFWSVAVPILAFLIGGYLAGRLRNAWAEASPEEVQFRDGMRDIFSFYASITADPYNFSRVEIVRGPASVLFGQGSIGGLVNLVSKSPEFETRGEISAVYGSYDRKELLGDVIPAQRGARD